MPFRVLIPLANPDNVHRLLDVAFPLVREYGGEIVALAVVELPKEMPHQEGIVYAKHKQPLLQDALLYAQQNDVPLITDIRLAHRLPRAIIRVAKESNAALIIMGWKGYTSTRERIFGEVADQVIRHAPCDLVLFKFAGGGPFRKILLASGGGSHIELAARLITTYNRAYGGELTLGTILSDESNVRLSRQAKRRLRRTVEYLGHGLPLTQRLIVAGSPTAGLLEVAGNYDLIVLGATEETLLGKVLFGEIPERVACDAPTSVMVAKRYRRGSLSRLLRRY
jgi:CIC family chloride channel protein